MLWICILKYNELEHITRSPSSSSTKNSRPHQQKLRLLLTTDVATWVSGFRVMWRFACRIFSGWLQAKNIFMLTLSSMTSLLIAHLSDQKWQMREGYMFIHLMNFTGKPFEDCLGRNILIWVAVSFIGRCVWRQWSRHSTENH